MVGLVSYYYGRFRGFHTPELFFLLMAVAFLVGTFCLIFSCLISISTASILSKTVFVSITNSFVCYLNYKRIFFILQEVVYHGIAFVFYLAASLTLLIEVNHRKNNYYYDYEPYFAASVRTLQFVIVSFVN